MKSRSLHFKLAGRGDSFPLKPAIRRFTFKFRWVFGAWVSITLGLAGGPAALAREGAVPAEVAQKAQTKGLVRVIVQLDVATRPEGALASRQAVLDQRQAIAAAQSELLADLARTNHRVTRQFETIPFLALEVGPDALAVLERSPRVVGVAEDRLAAPSLQGSVPLVEAPQAWDAGFDGTGWAVAVLDTGVDKDHPFLAGKVVEEACFSGNSNCPDGTKMQIGPGAGVPCAYAVTGCTHGTHVAGIAAGAGANFSGVAKGASLIAIQVFSRFTGADCGAGEDPCARSSTSDLVAGLQRVFALRDTLQIASVNMSLGVGGFTDQASCDADVNNAATKAAIDNLRSVGIATVAASGNDGFANALTAPACISTAVSVGATTRPDLEHPESVRPLSNSADFLSLLAPGSDINSSVPGGGFDTKSGTSQAAPHVAGAWAILKQSSPTATVPKVLSTLKCTGLKIRDPASGVITSRIRIFLALNALVSPTTFEIIDAPGAVRTEASAINDTGQIVGSFLDSTGATHGFLRDTDLSFTIIDVPGATVPVGTLASGINNAGQIVGTFGDVRGDHGFLRNTDGSFTTFDHPDGIVGFTSASGINNRGQIVGSFSDAGPRHGFLLSGGSFTTINVRDMFGNVLDTNASGINNAGQIVGSFRDLFFRGFLRDTSGSFTMIDVPGGFQTEAFGINGTGQIVGGFLTSTTGSHGFLLSGSSFTTFDVPGGFQTQARGINNSGQIVGKFGAGAFAVCGVEN
jgi:subtilisin family serine protease